MKRVLRGNSESAEWIRIPTHGQAGAHSARIGDTTNTLTSGIQSQSWRQTRNSAFNKSHYYHAFASPNPTKIHQLK
ncbi:hypothetical protein L484_006842 [Morus notabilis]|uniref:Uncharacterized protein n=1 Tax=Morus notabilis TaxID=981085 RepID=W9RKY7_9ROSA|nr:hypothetical protein L484_006842 [Morus notabilis]